MILTRQNLILWITVLFIGIGLLGCGKDFYSGSTETGFDHFPKNSKISPEKALDLARPYLAHSYELRKKKLTRKYTTPHTPFEMVVLKRDFYYITREDEPNKFVNFYIPYAVKVNKNTGEITKPDEKTDAMTQWKDF